MKRGKNEGVFHNLVEPIIPRFELKDILQVIIGASVLAVPIGFTEETWTLGEVLPMANIFGLLVLSVLFISMFTYYHYHKHTQREHFDTFVTRVLVTYLMAFVVVSLIMTLIQRAPWWYDPLLAFKRVVIVTFPSTMSAVIADTLK